MQNYNGYGAWLSTQAPFNQGNNYLQNAQNYQTQQNNFVKVYFVTNKQEANSIIPDPNGTPLFFFNKGSNEIYLKQVDTQTGLAIFKEYAEIKPVEKPIKEENLKKDINIYKEDFNALNDKLDTLQETFDSYIRQNSNKEIKGGKNVK